MSPAWVLLPLRGFLAVVFLYGGISKIADPRFLDPAAPQSIQATLAAVRHTSPIDGLLGPVANHAWGFGVLMAVAEVAVGLGMLFGLLTRVAAGGGMLLTLGLWLTVSWQSTPWFTSADLVYVFAFTPFLLGLPTPFSVDEWLARLQREMPDRREATTRRALLALAAAVVGGGLLALATAFRHRGSTSAHSSSSPPTTTPLAKASDVPVGGAKEVTDAATGHQVWVLQLTANHFTAVDAVCPHQGCAVSFVSAQQGFFCPCHGSTFTATGDLVTGPSPRGLTKIPVVAGDGEVRTT